MGQKDGWLARLHNQERLEEQTERRARARSIVSDSFAVMLHCVKPKPFAIARGTASMGECLDRRLLIPIDTVPSLFTCGA